MPHWRSPDSPAVYFPVLPPEAASQGNCCTAGLEVLLDAAAAAVAVPGGTADSAEGLRGLDWGPQTAATSQPASVAAGPHGPGAEVAGGVASAPGRQCAASACGGPPWASGKPPRPPALFSAQHLQPHMAVVEDGDVAVCSARPAVGAADVAEDVWDAFITGVAGAPGADSGGHTQQRGSVRTHDAAPLAVPVLHGGSELAGMLDDNADEVLAMLLGGNERCGGEEHASLRQGHAVPAAPSEVEVGAFGPDCMPAAVRHEGSEPLLPLSPGREKRRRSPEAEEAAAAVPVYVGGGGAPGDAFGSTMRARSDSAGLDQSIGACLRAISLPSVSSTAVSDLETPAAVGPAGGWAAGPFADVFGDLQAQESSVWGEACSADVEEVSVREQEPTLAHGLGPWSMGWDEGGGHGVRVVRHGAPGRGRAQNGSAPRGLPGMGIEGPEGEGSPFGSVVQEEGDEARHGVSSCGRAAGDVQLPGSVQGLGASRMGGTGQVGWMDNTELVRQMLEQGLSLSG